MGNCENEFRATQLCCRGGFTAKNRICDTSGTQDPLEYARFESNSYFQPGALSHSQFAVGHATSQTQILKIPGPNSSILSPLLPATKRSASRVGSYWSTSLKSIISSAQTNSFSPL